MDILAALDTDDHHEHHQAPPPGDVLDPADVAAGLHPDALPASLPVHAVEPVQTIDYPARTLTTAQVAVDATGPVQLANKLRNRASLLIVARGGGLYIGPDRFTLSTVSGFLIPDGASLELGTMSEVWAVCASGVTSTAHVLALVREG